MERAAYGKPFMLSAVDFTSDAGDAWIGWGFMPKSVKNTLYPKGYKGMLNKYNQQELEMYLNKNR